MRLNAPAGYGSSTFTVRRFSRGFLLPDGRRGTFSPLAISYDSVGGLTLDQIAMRLSKELDNAGHLSSAGVAGVLLAVVAASAPPDLRFDYIDGLLASMTVADLTQLVVLPNRNEVAYDTRIGRFRFAPIDLERLRYRTERAGSDYFSLWHGHLEGRLAIERDYHQVRVLSLSTTPALIGTASQPLWRLLVDDYFGELATSHFDQFWSAWKDDQLIFNALDVAYIPERILRQVLGLDTISIFADVGGSGRGWVAPGSQMLEMELGGSDRRIPAMTRQLAERYAFKDFGPSELDQSLLSFVRFVSRAREHMFEGSTSEGVLHFVIGLDLLFGERDASTKSVTSRAAAASSGGDAAAYANKVSDLASLYDARSKYVHAGQEIPSHLVTVADETCKQVLHWMLRLHRREQQSNQVITLGERLSALDFVSAAARARVPVNQDFRETWGLGETMDA